MWTKMRPMMHILCLVSDAFERFENLLSPTPPFHQNLYRLRLAALIFPLFAASRLVSIYMMYKGATFGIGFGLFGDPVLTPAINFMNQNFPNWPKLLRIDNFIFAGVPTNAQLTITLLRVGEANKAPLPPPPSTQGSPSQQPIDLHESVLSASGGDNPLNATDEELHKAIRYDSDMVNEAGGDDKEMTKSGSKHGKGAKALGVLRGAAKAMTKTAIGANKVRAGTGSVTAKNRLGAVPRPNSVPVADLAEFEARYQGKKGYVYINSESPSPCVEFRTTSTSVKEKVGLGDDDDNDLTWSVQIAEITELKKNPGYSFKSKLMAGWALEQKIRDGVEIVDKNGVSRIVTALPFRDELFNRLCSMGGQKWESW